MYSNNLDLRYHQLTENIGYLIDKIPQDILNYIKVDIDSIQENFINEVKMNDRLAGEIEHEYILKSSNDKLKQYIKGACQRFENNSQYYKNNFNTDGKLSFSDFWVNFQKKHEYNPKHKHGGVYSFVIWYQIPYYMENEQNISNKTKRNDCTNGQFHFLYSPKGDEHVWHQTLGVDKTKEGYIAVFPSELSHIVYPFYTSDEYRITISGNIVAEEYN